MGFYLNSKRPYLLFAEEARAKYFVDKSDILAYLIPEAEPTKEAGAESISDERSHKYICITRPRRFGKTVMANMIAAYFGRDTDAGSLFGGLKAAGLKGYRRHLNQHNVIHIMFNEMPRRCTSYDEYIERIETRLTEDLIRSYPDAGIREDDALWDAFNRIVEFGDGGKFIFVLDEWDFIFHREFVTETDKAAYIGFLSNLLKDQPYVEFVYMTGILPIAKYSSGSELNMFYEYTMAEEAMYSEYFGFTDEEVNDLFGRYQAQHLNPENVTREGLRLWYDGYHTKSGKQIYNPRSVVAALTNNNLGNYWTSSGPYDEIFYYIRENVDAVRDDLALMVSGIPVQAKIREYAATSMELRTKDEILSAMVVYGFLNCEDGYVSIPNKELMDKFADMLQKEPSLGYVYRLAAASERMLRATKAGDTKTMSEILEYTHNTESPLLSYNNEAELTMIVNLVYLSARDSYLIEREEQAGTGYVDFIFYPYRKDDDCIILELKAGHTPEEALQQIRDRNYALKFRGKLGEKARYNGRILAVGIAYDKKSKKHDCRVEIIKEKQD